MPATAIADLWTPTLWLQALNERLAVNPSLINSSAVNRGNANLVAAATGAGTAVRIPLWKDLTEVGGEEIQVEGTAPVTTHGITAAEMIAPTLNRVKKFGVNALAAAVSGGDPVERIMDALAVDRLKRRQSTLLRILRGSFGTLDQTPAEAEGAIRTMRADYFLEAGASPAAGQIMSYDKFIDSVSLLGELKDDLINGALWLHPTVLATLEKADAAGFQNGVQSGLPFTVRTYRGVPIFTSDLLVRNGATSGKVYETYVLSRDFIGTGEKPQMPDTGNTMDAATLQLDVNKDTNQTLLYDRTRFLMHINGMKWVGTPAGQSATDAELSLHSNWNLVASSASRIGGVAIRTNA